MYYASSKHEKVYRNVIRGKDYPCKTLAAIYLFTADRRLWQNWRLTLSDAGVDWEAHKPVDRGWSCYFLQQAALCIAGKGAAEVTLQDLLDYKDYPHEMFRLVVTALLIARCEPKASRAA